jgi:hypothetical protein
MSRGVRGGWINFILTKLLWLPCLFLACCLLLLNILINYLSLFLKFILIFHFQLFVDLLSMLFVRFISDSLYDSSCSLSGFSTHLNRFINNHRLILVLLLLIILLINMIRFVFTGILFFGPNVLHLGWFFRMIILFLFAFYHHGVDMGLLFYLLPLVQSYRVKLLLIFLWYLTKDLLLYSTFLSFKASFYTPTLCTNNLALFFVIILSRCTINWLAPLKLLLLNEILLYSFECPFVKLEGFILRTWLVLVYIFPRC